MKGLKIIFDDKKIPKPIQAFILEALQVTGAFKPTTLLTELQLSGFTTDANDICTSVSQFLPNLYNANQAFDPQLMLESKLLSQSVSEEEKKKTFNWLCRVLDRYKLFDRVSPTYPEQFNVILKKHLSNLLLPDSLEKYHCIALVINDEYQLDETLDVFKHKLNKNEAQHFFLLSEKQTFMCDHDSVLAKLKSINKNFEFEFGDEIKDLLQKIANIQTQEQSLPNLIFVHPDAVSTCKNIWNLENHSLNPSLTQFKTEIDKFVQRFLVDVFQLEMSNYLQTNHLNIKSQHQNSKKNVSINNFDKKAFSIGLLAGASMFFLARQTQEVNVVTELLNMVRKP